MQNIKQKKSRSILAVRESLCTQPLVCECSAWSFTWLLSASTRGDTCMIESVDLRVCACARACLCCLVSGCRRHSCVASAPRHTPDTVLLFPRSSPDLSTSLSPSHTSARTHKRKCAHNTRQNPCFSLLAGQLSVPALSLRHPPLSCIPLFISLPSSFTPSLSLSGSDPEAAC